MNVPMKAVSAKTHLICLNDSRNIPFNKLVLSQSNVRRVKSGLSIEELAEDIARRGLLQSLSVRPVLDDAGQETGMFEVPAGGRRFRALEILVRQKRLAKTAPVPTVVRDPSSQISAEEDSLAENVQRQGLHPLDQYQAFKALSEQGATDEDIAARFFVSPQVVKQRLRLAAVAPELLGLYAEDKIKLEQLMAFSITTDHARQLQVWEAIKDGYLQAAYHIRRLLTETTVDASDRRVRFVGLAAYRAAGGIVDRDLFQDDDGGWLQDPALLDRLVTERLTLEAEAVGAEGWKWVEANLNLPYGSTNGLRKVIGETVQLSEAETLELDAAVAEFDQLSEEFEDCEELPAEIDARMGALEAIIDGYAARPAIYPDDERARAGAFVTVSPEGNLVIDRGYIHPEDEERVEPDLLVVDVDGEGANGEGELPSPTVQRAIISVGGQPPAPGEDEDDNAVRPLGDRLLIELTAYRTVALRDALASNPRVAMTALLHRLVSDTFLRLMSGGCLQANVRQVSFSEQSSDLKDSPPAVGISGRQNAWAEAIPADDDGLWAWIDGMDEDNRGSLLAHCVSFGVNALFEKINPYGGGTSEQGLRQRFAQADRLSRAVGLDLVDAGWHPTVENYLGRVTKPRILEAVREGAGDRAVQMIEHMKKGDMAKEAERLLEGSGWLPEILRLDELEAPAEHGAGAGLPEFLAGDGDEDEPVTDDEEASQAAE